VFITSAIRGHPAEVLLGRGEGLRHESAANCDYLLPVEMSQFTRRVGRLGVAKLLELEQALKVALGLT
jgi:mRNA-degrading endonuclease toxin of MazEF toxin-antitoxin module